MSERELLMWIQGYLEAKGKMLSDGDVRIINEKINDVLDKGTTSPRFHPYPTTLPHSYDFSPSPYPPGTIYCSTPTDKFDVVKPIELESTKSEK